MLDVGCGSGALSEAALAAGAARVTGVDLSPAYVESTRALLGGERARFEVADAQALPFPDASFDAAASGLVANFLPEPLRMAREMRRVVRPGGVVALYVWDYAGKMEMLRRFWDAAGVLDARAKALDEGARFPLCQPEALHALFCDAGFAGVETRAIDVPTVFADFEDLWRPFLGGQGPAPGYLASLEPKAHDALREEMRRRVPARGDGSIALVARAWAVKGRS